MKTLNEKLEAKDSTLTPWELTVKNVLKEGFSNKAPCCDGVRGCLNPIGYIDHKGWVYCNSHGKSAQATRRCRKLTASEIKTLTFGKPIPYTRAKAAK